MKPVDMASTHDPPDSYGDCFRACVASVLTVPGAAVPHFLADGGEGGWWSDFVQWCADRGLEPYEQSAARFMPPGFYIGTGKSPRGDWNHAVVLRDRELAHDPHPDDKRGIETTLWVMGFYLVDARTFTRWRARAVNS